MGDQVANILPLAAFAGGLLRPQAASNTARAADLVVQQQRYEQDRADRFAEMQQRQAQFQQQHALSQSADVRSARQLAMTERQEQARRRALGLLPTLPTGQQVPFSLPAIAGQSAFPEYEAEVGAAPGAPEVDLGAMFQPTTQAGAFKAIGGMAEPEDVRGELAGLVMGSSKFPLSAPPEVSARQQRVQGALAGRQALIERGIDPRQAQSIAEMMASGSPLANEFAQEAMKPDTVPHVTGSHVVAINRRTGQVTGVMPLPQAPQNAVSVVTNARGDAVAVGVTRDPQTGRMTTDIKPLGVQLKLPEGSDLTTLVAMLSGAPDAATAQLLHARLITLHPEYRDIPFAAAWQMAQTMIEQKRAQNIFGTVFKGLLDPTKPAPAGQPAPPSGQEPTRIIGVTPIP